MNNPLPDAARLEAARRAQRLAEAKNLSRRYVLIATGFALVPFPVVDIAAVLALQVKLVHDLAHLYGVPFESRMAKPLLASLLSCGAVSGGGLLLMGLGFTIPALRTLVGGGFSGGLAGTTLATSEIFIRHFEAGGTLLNFDPNIALLPPQSSPQPSVPFSLEAPDRAPLRQAHTPTSSHGPQEALASQGDPGSLVPTSEPLVERQNASPLQATAAEEPEAPQQSKPSASDSQSSRPELSETQPSDLAEIYGIGAIYRDRLFAVGVRDFASLAALKPEAIKQILGSRVSLASARDFIAQAKARLPVNSS